MERRGLQFGCAMRVVFVLGGLRTEARISLRCGWSSCLRCLGIGKRRYCLSDGGDRRGRADGAFLRARPDAQRRLLHPRLSGSHRRVLGGWPRSRLYFLRPGAAGGALRQRRTAAQPRASSPDRPAPLSPPPEIAIRDAGKVLEAGHAVRRRMPAQPAGPGLVLARARRDAPAGILGAPQRLQRRQSPVPEHA